MQQQEQHKQEHRSLKQVMLEPIVPGHPWWSLLAVVAILVLVFKVM
jgi:hypothetical protein